MKKICFVLISILSSSLHASSLLAQQNSNNTTDDGRSVAITVYNDDLGVVRDVRKFSIKDGTSEVRMVDVPSRIDPTTVKITDLDHPKDLDVLEQNYEYDLVNQDKLLQKYIDKSITLVSNSGKRIVGTVLAVEGGQLMLMTDSGIVSIAGLTGYTLSMSSIANGLYTKPTLIWQLKSDRTLTNEPLEVLYQTGGMTWHAEYIAALTDDEKSLDLTGWVSIENTSGASFPDAKLKLVAGALHRAPPERSVIYQKGMMADMAAGSPQFQEHGMFEYHVYDLGRQTTINNDEVKQISLLTANSVGSEKHYTYEGGKDVAVTISFQNSEVNHLGIPLPMGVIRVMKRDNDGTLEFIGEDRIEHTPRDEKLTLHVGNAFDLVGDRQVTSSRTLGEHESEETVEITLKNHKDEDVTIDAVENLGTDWEIIQKSMDYEKKNASSIVLHVPVKARSEQKVTYTVQHRW
jgi:hypothetical protein